MADFLRLTDLVPWSYTHVFARFVEVFYSGSFLTRNRIHGFNCSTFRHDQQLGSKSFMIWTREDIRFDQIIISLNCFFILIVIKSIKLSFLQVNRWSNLLNLLFFLFHLLRNNFHPEICNSMVLSDLGDHFFIYRLSWFVVFYCTLALEGQRPIEFKWVRVHLFLRIYDGSPPLELCFRHYLLDLFFSRLFALPHNKNSIFCQLLKVLRNVNFFPWD